jgi:hypothetical protein
MRRALIAPVAQVTTKIDGSLSDVARGRAVDAHDVIRRFLMLKG